MACDVCRGADFVNVEAVKFVLGDNDHYIRPDVFGFHATYCPRCGERLPEHRQRVKDGRV